MRELPDRSNLGPGGRVPRRQTAAIAGPFVEALDAPVVESRQGEPEGYRTIRQLIWLYFWLLMLEGPLRKWILPGLANPLLLVKEPVVIMAYFVAMQHRCFPRNAFVTWTFVLGGLTLLVAVVAVSLHQNRSNLFIALYGFRTNFFYLPFIFLMADVLDGSDLRKLGKWLLILSLPTALLVFLQFQAGPDALVNVGAGKSIGGQMDAGVAIRDVAKTRAAGPFSFNTGLASFLALVAAFLIDHFQRGKIEPKWLAVASLLAVAGSTVLSSSRLISLSVIMVFAVALLCVWLQPRLMQRSAWLFGAVALIALLFTVSRIASEGIFVLSTRFEAGHGFKVGIVERTISSFTDVSKELAGTGYLGMGLGIGTNVAGGMLTGKRSFLVSESEWPRIIGEVGPVFGFAYIALRVAIFLGLAGRSLRALRKGDPLAMLLLGAFGLLMLNGQFGTAQTVGFAAFGAGLILVAAKQPGEVEVAGPLPPMPEIATPPPRAVRGRSPYAEHLHSERRA